jgi:hypothetical protein
MDEEELITTLVSHLNSSVSVPIRTSGLEDERPVPVVIIDDWDTNDLNVHNSAFAGEASGDFNGDGSQEYERYLRFDFETRIEFLVRDSDEVDVTTLKDSVKNELRLISEYPQSFHESLKYCHLGAGGNPTFRFTEPKESELMLSARFGGDHVVTLTEGDLEDDILADVTEAFTFTN